MAGRARSRLILTPSPREKITAPRSHCFLWKKQIARKRNEMAKQSLKHLRRKMLCRRLDRISMG